MLAFLGTLLLAVLANAQRPEPCGKDPFNTRTLFEDAFTQGLGVYGIQGDFKSGIRCCDAILRP